MHSSPVDLLVSSLANSDSKDANPAAFSLLVGLGNVTRCRIGEPGKDDVPSRHHPECKELHKLLIYGAHLSIAHCF